MFTQHDGDQVIYLIVYVDDVIITGNNSAGIDAVKKQLDIVFKIKDLGLLHFFLGMEFQYVDGGIFINHRKYAENLLVQSGCNLAKHCNSPLDCSQKLRADAGDLFADVERYRSLIGKLNYLTNTRPDIAFVVQQLSQYLKEPRNIHFKAVVHLLRYIKGSLHIGVFINDSPDFTLTAYSDSD